MSDANKPVQVHIMRSQLGRARGLGAAKSGAAHWWAQRLTAVALVPLTLWFVW
jgi:succinate dehydrogenase / fumarate reductase membrane anchor subunit